MITIRQIEKLWNARAYEKLLQALTSFRPESFLQSQPRESFCAPAAAMALIRLDELDLSDHPICEKFLRTLIATQDRDGGWCDAPTTALCIRAMTLTSGNGPCVVAALTYLASLQKTEGVWPRVPIRRTDADALGSAFILYQLAERSDFRAAVRFEDAVDWFAMNQLSLDGAARQMWLYATNRCRAERQARAA